MVLHDGFDALSQVKQLTKSKNYTICLQNL